MKLIPSEKIEITTTLSIQEVKTLLKENIQPKRGISPLFKKANNKTFEGVLTKDMFQIQRVITGRNSFIPQIKGKVQSTVNGTTIIASLKLNIVVIVFMSIWLSGVFLGFIGVIFGILRQGTNPIFSIAPLIMIAFGVGLTHYGFNSEKDKSINELKRILNGKIKEYS